MAAFYANAPLPDTNARQLAQTIRPSSTALLTIDSEDRYKNYVQARANPTSPYNFSITKNESLMPGFMTRIGISEVVLPWSIPNINLKTQSINVVYNIGAGEVPFTLYIPVGFYTPNELASVLQADISGAGATGFTMTYGSALVDISNAVIVAFDAPYFSYSMGDPTHTIRFLPMQYNSASYPYSSQTKQLFDILGFTSENSEDLAQGVSGYTLCQAIRYVDIVCNQLTNSQAQKDQTSQTIARDMLCRIYLGDGGAGGQSTVQPSSSSFCPPGCAPTVIYRNFTMPKQIQWIPNQNIPGFLQFQVYDDAGDLLDASLTLPGSGALIPTTPGAIVGQALDWSMTMLCSEC
jgi:hypothetical protein